MRTEALAQGLSRQAIQKHLHTLRDLKLIKHEKGSRKYRGGEVAGGLHIYFEFQNIKR